MRRHLLATSCCSLVLFATMASVAAASCPSRPPLLVPSTGTLLGAYVNPDETWNGLDDDRRKVASFEGSIGRKLDIDMHYYRWDDAFPTALEAWDVEQCRIPLISWAGSDLDPIIKGQRDALIRSRARAVRRFEHPLFIRWGYEMNGDWWDWTAGRSPETATKFVQAWRRIHRLFRAAGARNAVWVWAPNETELPTEPWKDPRRYYPGDDVVDWIGFDGYNWGTTQDWSQWRSFAAIFRPLYNAFAGRKPLMISETASTERGGDKAAWIDQIAPSLRNEFPRVRALVWFHSNKETDWRATSSVTATDAIRRLADSLQALAPRAIASTRRSSCRASTVPRRSLRGRAR